MTFVMCSSNGRSNSAAPFSMSSRFTAAANDLCFIFFRTLLVVIPVNFGHVQPFARSMEHLD